MINQLKETIDDVNILSNRMIYRSGFAFTSITYPVNIFDSVIIKLERFESFTEFDKLTNLHSINEYIQLVNNFQLEKAILIGNDLSFLESCPTLKHLMILPSMKEEISYKYLYNHPELRSIVWKIDHLRNSAFKDETDYSRIYGLVQLNAESKTNESFKNVTTLRSLSVYNQATSDLNGLFVSTELDTLKITQSGIKSLDGINISNKMQCVYLHYNRNLSDISSLSEVKGTIKALRISNCPKILDFSVLGCLVNLELLELSGSNIIENLDFIKNLKSLKTFIFDFNVLDGDLTPCLNLKYAVSKKNRKHYNYKDSSLPKKSYFRGNDGIEQWRRME